jgi:hypothetical protein
MIIVLFYFNSAKLVIFWDKTKKLEGNLQSQPYIFGFLAIITYLCTQK